MQLEDILEYAENLDANDNAKISLYFVTRHIKPGMSPRAKVLDKYDFKLTQAPISPDISSYFRTILANQIQSHASRDEVEVKPYTVIDDDLNNKIYTYSLNNAIAFADVINDKIKSDNIPQLDNLSDIQSDLWAYCIKVEIDGEYTYSFRKIGKAKVTTNEAQDIKQKISAMFDKKGQELKEFDGSVVSFDDKIDCIYIREQFFVFQKKSFENIVGLEEEFKAAAVKTLKIIKDCNMVEGLEVLEEAITYKPSLRKTLTHIAEKGNHTTLDANEIKSMNEVLKKFQDTEFNINDEGKIVLENADDGKNFLRLLNDYYKQGMTTKKYYATDSGSLVTPSS